MKTLWIVTGNAIEIEGTFDTHNVCAFNTVEDAHKCLEKIEEDLIRAGFDARLEVREGYEDDRSQDIVDIKNSCYSEEWFDIDEIWMPENEDDLGKVIEAFV